MSNPPAEPFFLDASPGKRFCLYHPPAENISASQALIYLHPFAEEMNKSRRMAALQARAFAAAGLGGLEIYFYAAGIAKEILERLPGKSGRVMWPVPDNG